jgi:hypothetical protein
LLGKIIKNKMKKFKDGDDYIDATLAKPGEDPCGG